MDYLTITELGQIIGVPYHTLRYHVRRGNLTPDLEIGADNKRFLFATGRVQEIAAIPEIAVAKRKRERDIQ